ncbi:MAG: hypothetical protein OXT65_05095 [Alphaproteobacteria bacterium]|nr:hypothetical protein [Alphaproteobacteria bacterium]
MTDVRNNDRSLIATAEDVIPLYAGNNLPDSEQTIGMETEIGIRGTDAQGSPRLASAAECATLVKNLSRDTAGAQLEMVSAVEYASPPFRVTETEELSRTVETARQAFFKGIENNGFTPVDSALHDFATMDAAKANLVNRDRARGLVRGMAMHKDPAFLKVTLLCTSTQVSLSYKDPDDLLDMLKTGYALTPAIFGIFENHPTRVEGKAEPCTGSPRAQWYGQFGKDGGIPDSVLQAKDGADLIRRHAEQVFDTQMLYYYDNSGDIVWPEERVTFHDLQKDGLNTRSNYDLAETFIYTHIKICNIRDAEGTPTGKRIELRAFDGGEPGLSGATPFAIATLRDPVAREQVKGLLYEYGFAPDNPDYGTRVREACGAIANHNGKYLDVPFGVKPDGTKGTLKNFAKDLGDILQLYAQRHPEAGKALAGTIEVCKTGLNKAEQAARTEAAAKPVNDNTLRRKFGNG